MDLKEGASGWAFADSSWAPTKNKFASEQKSWFADSFRWPLLPSPTVGNAGALCWSPIFRVLHIRPRLSVSVSVVDFSNQTYRRQQGAGESLSVVRPGKPPLGGTAFLQRLCGLEAISAHGVGELSRAHLVLSFPLSFS